MPLYNIILDTAAFLWYPAQHCDFPLWELVSIQELLGWFTCILRFQTHTLSCIGMSQHWDGFVESGGVQRCRMWSPRTNCVASVYELCLCIDDCTVSYFSEAVPMDHELVALHFASAVNRVHDLDDHAALRWAPGCMPMRPWMFHHFSINSTIVHGLSALSCFGCLHSTFPWNGACCSRADLKASEWITPVTLHIHVFSARPDILVRHIIG